MRIALEVAKCRYGKIQGNTWVDESFWCVFVPIPDGLRLINSETGLPMARIYCNRDMAGPLASALKNLVERGLAGEVETFDGCLMVRDVRGCPGSLSAHAYALAIDLDAKQNPLGGPVAFSPAFVKCFTDAGFDWGGDFKRKDPMHFSFAWEGRDQTGTPQ